MSIGEYISAEISRRNFQTKIAPTLWGLIACHNFQIFCDIYVLKTSVHTATRIQG
jgi:hypothetical protein